MKKQLIAFVLAASLLLPANAAAVSESGMTELMNTSTASGGTAIQKEVYEAEDATLSGGARKATNHDDYSGTGFIDGMVSGSSVSFKVDASEAGNYGVRLRYTNGSGAGKTINVYVGGTLVRTAALTQTINWDTWDVHLDSLPLAVGANTITYKLDTGNTAADVKLDKISLSRIYEAEDAVLTGGMKKVADHAGFSGSGFSAGFDNHGDGVTFTVNVPEAGDYSLITRYANGSDSGQREASLYVNNVDIMRLGVAAMGSWDIWSDAQATVHLNEGTNTITFQRDPSDNGCFNLDYITLKKCSWEYAGNVTGFTGNNTKQLTFNCDNAKIQVTSVASNMVKVWCEPAGRFERKYDSFSVVNEEIDPKNLSVSNKGAYYEFSTDTMVVRINKAPFKITYLDKAGNILCENDEKSMGWSTDGEVVVNNKLQADEHFWGLGEKNTSFDRLGKELAMWSSDVAGGSVDSSVPSTYDEGRWYMANPYFVSSKGYSVFFDNASRTVFDLGKSDPNQYSFGALNPNPGGELLYYFTYGPSVKQITKTYTDLVGKSFFAPEWALGNIQAHWGYNQADVERVAQTYRDKQIPLDMIMTDIDWYKYKCSPTEEDKTLFPDLAGMMSTLGGLHVKWGAINDPNITNLDNNADFADGVANGHFVKNQAGQTRLVTWPWGGPSGLTDFFKPAAQEWWGGLLKNVLDVGVSSFWMDMNEPSNYRTDWVFYNQDGKSYGTLSEVKNAYALKQNETLFNEIKKYNEANGSDNRPFLITRSGFTGTQRYASPWTGDIDSSWRSMHEQIGLGTGLSISGYNYWGFDIGGFSGGVTNDQYKRWVQLATFTPVHRFHYMIGLEAKEPWTHDAEEVSRNQINLRYRLIPYLYSLTADNIIGIGIEEGLGEGGTGLPLARPMVMEYPDDQRTWNMDSQFMSGSSFLVAPVYTNTTVKNVYLPEGKWYDYKDGTTVYGGQQYLNYDAPIDTLPVFVKAGAIVPMQPEMQYVGEKPVDVMTLDIYPLTENGSSHFVLYEDDGTTDDYQSGVYATTRYTSEIRINGKNETHTFKIGARTGSYTGIAERSYLMQFHNSALKNLTVKQDGGNLQQYDSLEKLTSAVSGYYADPASHICYVKVPDEAAASTIVLTGEVFSDTAVYEAEAGTLLGNARVSAAGTGYTGTGYVEGISAASNGVRFEKVTVPADGDYALHIAYANKGSAAATLTVKSGAGTAKATFPAVNGWDSSVAVVSLKAGENTISLTREAGDAGTVSVDSISLKASPVVLRELTGQTLQAEEAVQLGNAVVKNDTATYSGFRYSAGFSAAGDGVRFEGADVLADGTYAVALRYGNGNSEAQTMKVYANNDTGSAVSVTFPKMAKWENWNEVIVNLPLKAGTNTITVVSAGGASDINLESIQYAVTPVTMTQVPLQNGGFETGNTDGWTLTNISGGTGRGVDSNDVYEGSKKFYFYSVASKQRISRTVTLPDGVYRVSAWTKLSNAEPNEAKMEIGGYDADAAVSLDLQHNSSWQKYEATVEVKDGKLTVGFYLDAPDWSSMQLDDVQIWKVDAKTGGEYKSVLQAAITELSALKKSDYTKASWNSFETALRVSERVFANVDASVGQIYGAYVLLGQTKSALVESGGGLPGDLNGDGKLDASDVVELRRILLAGGTPTAEQIEAGDLSGDGRLTSEDVDLLLEQLDILPGDVNGDAKLTALDIMQMRKRMLDGTVTDAELAAGDLDGNGTLTALDIMKLRKRMLESV